MGKSYVGVKRNPAGTGWVYSVHKPGKSRISHLRSVFPTAKKAAVYRELEIIREKYDQELPANKRNFADEELPKVKSESTKEMATKPKPAEVVETDETEAEPAEIAQIEDKPQKGKKDKKKKSDKKNNKKGKGKKKKIKSGKKDNKKDKGKKKKIKNNKEK